MNINDIMKSKNGLADFSEEELDEFFKDGGQSPTKKTPPKEDKKISIPRGQSLKSEDTSKKPGRKPKDSEDLSKISNADAINITLRLQRLPDIDYDNPDEIAQRVVDFFEICEEYDIRPNMPLLAIALHISYRLLRDWETGTRRKSNATPIIQQAKLLLQAQMDTLGTHGKLNPTTHIFLMKNYFGYKDQTDLALAQPQTEEDEKLSDPEELKRKYLQSASATIPEPPQK